MEISHSELRTWRTCHRQWYLNYFLEFAARSAESPVGNAQLGTRIHAALEAYYGYGLQPLEVLGFLYDKSVSERPDFEPELERERGYALAMVEGYLDWAASEGVDAGYEVLATEHEVRHEITLSSGPVTFRGKLDQLVRREMDGAILFRDWKPQPLTELVLTPTGWAKMGDLRPGDVICGAHKEEVSVKRVHDRGVDQVYKITFNDGTSVRATADHPWLAKKYRHAKTALIETSSLQRGSYIARFTPITTDEDHTLPVDPYLLGSWIANGHRNATVITDGDLPVLTDLGLAVKPIRRRGHQQQYEAVITTDIRKEMVNLGLFGKYSSERFIPSLYIHQASYSQRLSLLRGLMDGDGSLGQSINYNTTSSQLADNVADLVRSLGGWASIWKNPRPCSYLDKKVGTRIYTGTSEYRVVIRCEFNPFRSSVNAVLLEDRRNRIASAIDKRKRGVGRSHNSPAPLKIVRSVEPDGIEPVRCIELESEEQLYVTSGYTVTHNTVGTLTKANILVLDTQMRFYAMLQSLAHPDQRTDGGLYVMLLRSKHTERAKGPFYDQIEVRYNRHDLNSIYLHAKAIAHEIVSARQRLSDGGDHREIVYASPGDHCRWQCPFVNICPLMDDNSRWEDALSAQFSRSNPYARYSDDTILTIRKALEK